MNIIGEKLAELHKAKGMTQEELATTIGVSAQSISKWENSATMPDIMLLPVIADIFEVSIDTLFGKENDRNKKTITIDDVIDESFDTLLLQMQRAWMQDSYMSEINTSCEDGVEKTKKFLDEYPESQTAMYSGKNGAVYANSEIGLIFKNPKEGCLNLFENEDAIGLLQALSDKTFRAILIYQLKNYSVSYTVSSVTKKCGLNAEDTERALILLEKYQFVEARNVELDSETIKVYNLTGSHKMLLIYAIMTLGKRLANYHELYYNFSGITGGWLY